jgi:DNA polymerase-1
LTAPKDSPKGAGGTAAFEIKEVKDGKELLSAAREAGLTDFCVSFDKDGISSAAFAFGSFVLAAAEKDTAGFADALFTLFADGEIKKRTHDVKKIYAFCKKNGKGFEGFIFDTMLAGYILNPLASSYEPERLSGELGLAAPEIKGAEGLSPDVSSCARNAATINLLCGPLDEEIEKNGQKKLFYEIEMPLARVLAGMENRGFTVDDRGISSFGETLAEKICEIQSEIYAYAGYEFNINSPRQLGEVLFIKLGLPPKKKTKTGFSTDVDVLEALWGRHPVIELLLEFRKLVKLKQTYTDGLLKVIAPDGRIHTSFSQVDTRTGRISSTEPNLQNIPVRSQTGRELRRFFVAAPGNVLVDADYSQIELRILAHVADDSAMIDAFNSNVDIHTLTASQVFKMPPQMVTPLMRGRAKAVNFGIVYGIGAFSLSQDIGVTVKEADNYIKSYFETFFGVKKYMEEIVRRAYDSGYVETLLGRRRALPELSSSNRNIRNFGERAARNTPIQGTAADIIKIAMIKVEERLERENFKARLILQVHDELIVEAPAGEANAVSRILKEEMENAMSLKVKLRAEVHTGPTWYDAKG